MRKSNKVSMNKAFKFLIGSVIVATGVFVFAWYHNIATKSTQQSQQLIVSWLDSFKSQDFKTCDLLPQSKNYRLDSSTFTYDSSSVVYDEALIFLAKNIKVDSVTPKNKSDFEVTIKVPICSLDSSEFTNISTDASAKLSDSISNYASKKYSSSDFNDKNREILLTTLISVLNKSKTGDYVTVKQVLHVESDGTVRNTRNLVYKMFSESKVNDVLQSYINNLDVYIDYKTIK